MMSEEAGFQFNAWEPMEGEPMVELHQVGKIGIEMRVTDEHGHKVLIRITAIKMRTLMNELHHALDVMGYIE